MPIIVHYSGSSGTPAPGNGGERGPDGGPGRQPNARTLALAITALGVGALLLAFGLVLLAAVAAVGVVGGGAVLLYHRVTGRLPRFLRVSGGTGTLERGSGLDPLQEVFPEQQDDRRELPPPPDER